MLSSIQAEDEIKPIKYFVMRNEVTFTDSDPLELPSARAPAGRENRSRYQLFRCASLQSRHKL
jgi:hypothetical protein